MYTETYKGINSFLKGACQLLLTEGIKRKTRGYSCYELPEPFLFKLTEPQSRIVTIPERKWNKTLPYAESLWIASGRNDLSYICHYLNRMKEFSDDGIFMRGGYGPRFRNYNGLTTDYQIRTVNVRQEGSVDQLRYIVECFSKDSETRRAVITFGDPMKDDFDHHGMLKESKDIPCTRELHFVKQAVSNKLDLIVKMRSNDLIWGASAVNIFNYTFMQEYVAAILGMEVGNYYHLADNMHYYESFKTLVEKLANIPEVEDKASIYHKSFHSLKEFDALVSKLGHEEELMRKDFPSYQRTEMKDDFFQHWYDALYLYNHQKNNK